MPVIFSSSARAYKPWFNNRGFTLIEITIVAAIIAIGSSLMVLAWRESDIRTLEREGDRLAALLESARIHSRASGQPITWRATNSGFVFSGNAKIFIKTLPTNWESSQVQASSSAPILLGPEPMLEAQSISLFLKNDASNKRILVITNGLEPFHVEVL